MQRAIDRKREERQQCWLNPFACAMGRSTVYDRWGLRHLNFVVSCCMATRLRIKLRIELSFTVIKSFWGVHVQVLAETFAQRWAVSLSRRLVAEVIGMQTQPWSTWTFKGFYWPKQRDENDVQKFWIRYFGVLHHQQGRSKEKEGRKSCRYIILVVDIMYQRQLLLRSALLTVYRNIGFRLFVHCFRLAFWSIKSFETWECASGIVGCSPYYTWTFLTKMSRLMALDWSPATMTVPFRFQVTVGWN